jgi:hypothetical protein
MPFISPWELDNILQACMMTKREGRMEATIMKRKQIDMPGRYSITIEAADDLADNELVLMLEFVKAELFSLQNHDRGDDAERKARFRTWMTL